MENNTHMKEVVDTSKKNGESIREMVDLQKAQLLCLTELSGTIKEMNSNLEAFLKIAVQKKQVEDSGTSLIQPKLEFPEFDGEDPRGWITRANQFFEKNPMAEISKLDLAGLHMSGPADMWFRESVNVAQMNWESFCKLLVRRFRRSVPRYLGEVNGRKLSVHFVIGSTHSFMNSGTAKELNCYLEEVKPPGLVNFIAGNGVVLVNKKCSKFVWSMRGHKFEAELLTMPLARCDIILGANWVSKQIMSFSNEGVEIRKGREMILLEEFEEEAGYADVAECFAMTEFSISTPLIYR